MTYNIPEKTIVSSLFFDLDGTVTDSKEGIILSLQFALNACGYPHVDYDQLIQYIGPPLPKIFQLVTGESNSEKINQMVSIYRERYSVKGLFESMLYPGIKELLYSLHSNYTLYIVTSKPQVYAQQIVQHFGIHNIFTGIYGSNLDNTLSDKTELIHHVLTVEQLAPESTIMIGDRSHDMIGAVNNSLTPIGVLWGYGSRDELKQSGAVHIAEVPADIATIV